ncbi:MAG: hypothetical protein ACLFV5_10065 [Anaerolineales bacterium]
MIDNENPFRQAEGRFRQLTDDYSAGRMDGDSYRAALGQIRVTDAEGNLWMLQEGSGAWHRWTGSEWMDASPYERAASAPIGEKAGGGGILLKLLGVTLFWLAVIGAVLIFVPEAGQGLALGLAAAGALSLILMTVQLLRQWEGEIIDMRQEREHVNDEDEGYTRTVTYAYIRQPSGKVRKQRAARDWQIGDHLQKQRGESGIRKLN